MKGLKMTYQRMYEYYQGQEVLPTYGSFRSPADLDAHERQRRTIFAEKLFLPPRCFRGGQLIEFGPDAGENSLVFARWGASCTLVEPNIKAHPIIREYFQRFALEDRLVALYESDIHAIAEHPVPVQKFDFIDAEGFIYTVRPESLWINLFSRLLRDEGFVILFYCDLFGSFFELFLKVIHSRVCRLTGLDSNEAAQTLFSAKWNSISHKRSMRSWVMDVLENPFVRARFFLEPQSLCSQMHRAGFALYSSWPPYHDGLGVHWFKKTLTAGEQVRAQNDFIARSRLSHLFGRKHFLVQLDPELEAMLSSLLTLTDGLIDAFDADRAAQCADHMSALARLVESDAVLADADDTRETIWAIRSVRQILDLLARGAVGDLTMFCNTDQPFIQTWGMPSHFAVFRKAGT